MPDLVQRHGSLSALIDGAQSVWPSIAAYPEDVRLAFAQAVNLYQQWLSLPRNQRGPVVMQAAIVMKLSRDNVVKLFRHLHKTHDYKSLLPKPRADRGQARKWDDAALEYLKTRYFALRNKQRAYQDMTEVCESTGLRFGSYRSACTHIKAWEAETHTQALMAINHKTKDYSDVYEAPFLRDTTDLRPLEVICGDHHQFDVVILWPDGTVVRPWVSAWIDVRTRRWLGLTVCKSPDSRSIADSLYWTIKRLGIPENIYIDNGKAYRARILKGTVFSEEELGRIDIPPDVSEMVDALQKGLYGNSRRVHALPFNARAKVVERYFGIGGFSDWCKGLPGWTGRRYDQMPDDTRKRIKARKLMTFDQFLMALLDEVRRMNSRASRAHGMGGASPNEVMQWYIDRGWRPHRPTNEHLIDLMAMNTTTRRVRAYGIQHGSTQSDPMFYWAEELRAYNRQDVIVKWASSEMTMRKVFSIDSPDGATFRAVPRELLVFTLKGEYICSAAPVHRRQYLDDPGIGDALRERNHRRKELKAELNEMKEFADYVQLPPALNGEEEIVEPKKLKLVKKDSLSEMHDEIVAKRKEKGRYREILSRPRPQEDDGGEVIL